MVRLMPSEQSESHIWEFTVAAAGTNYMAVGTLSDINVNYCSNSLTITLSNDHREWISSVQIQMTHHFSRDEWVTEFNLYGRNSDTDEWTLLKEVTGLTYSISGQKKRIYLSNNTPYNQFMFENFGTGNPSSCFGYIQSLDLFADNTLADIPNFTYDSSITVFKYAEMTEVIPQNGDGYMNFRINPSLPTGIVLDPHTGWISGTATAESTTQTYTITATKMTGGDVTATISLSVSICTGGKGLMTVRIYADYDREENSWKLYEGRGTSGTVLQSVSKIPEYYEYYYVDFCLDDGIYTFEVTNIYENRWYYDSGYTLTVDYGEMELDIMKMNGQDYKPIYASTVFSTYFPFQIEYTDWKVIQSDVSSDWNTVSFDDSTWNTYKAVDIPSTSSITTYIRKSFTMSGVNDYQVLNVRVKYSGGVAAYLNGNLVARFNLEEDFDSTSLSITDHDASVFSKFHVILSTSGIEEGSNVFSFEIHRPLSGSSSDPVVFDATGVFGVEDCSTVVDSYSSLTSTELLRGTVADIMDLDPCTYGVLPNTIGTYIEWTVENLEGSKWNSFNILIGDYGSYSVGFDIYGYSNPDGEQESVTILNAVNQTVTSRTKPQIAVPEALTGFRRYRWQVTKVISNDFYVDSIHMAYCKDPRYNDPNWTPGPTPTPTSTLIPTTIPPTTVLPTTSVPTTIPPTTPPPSSEFIASSDWDSIPLNVQSLIFDSNSFPDIIDVDLSNFTSLQSLQFREGSFASASSLTIIGYH
ncbi:cadherin domain-containing protein, partial [Blastocystis sp. subtype 4]|uniref:cadherin domain-containing protein n=1 Tax=Blastocystis sp. subtype 4 TaxID=944170 RepID=UPI0007122628